MRNNTGQLTFLDSQLQQVRQVPVFNYRLHENQKITTKKEQDLQLGTQNTYQDISKQQRLNIIFRSPKI